MITQLFRTFNGNIARHVVVYIALDFQTGGRHDFRTDRYKTHKRTEATNDINCLICSYCIDVTI